MITISHSANINILMEANLKKSTTEHLIAIWVKVDLTLDPISKNQKVISCNEQSL